MQLPQWARDARSMVFEQIALFRWARLRADRPGKPHGLPGELIISLTSYPPRFPTLALTLACLCDQTVRADRIILWVTQADTPLLPREVRWGLRQAGIEIRYSEDIGPYKKLIPSLEAFPSAFIVTADDDLSYPRNWLEALVAEFDGRSIVCLWGTRVIVGQPRWGTLARNGDAVLPGSGAGVLFPPDSLDPKVTDRSFLDLCPTGDDLWYYKMARLPIRKVGHFKLIHWRGTQEQALAHANLGGGNERMFAAISSARSC